MLAANDPPADPAKPDDSSSSADADGTSTSPGRRLGPDDRHCEICGFPLVLEHHCKIVCPNCGYTRDCSDP